MKPEVETDIYRYKNFAYAIVARAAMDYRDNYRFFYKLQVKDGWTIEKAVKYAEDEIIDEKYSLMHVGKYTPHEPGEETLSMARRRSSIQLRVNNLTNALKERKSLVDFFLSDYCRTISEVDGRSIMRTIEKQVEENRIFRCQSDVFGKDDRVCTLYQ